MGHVVIIFGMKIEMKNGVFQTLCQSGEIKPFFGLNHPESNLTKRLYPLALEHRKHCEGFECFRGPLSESVLSVK